MPRGEFATLDHDGVPLRVKVRFAEYVFAESRDPDACWEWPLSTASHGYGQIGWGVRPERGLVLTHRLAWLLFHGPIPAGMTVDHECRNRPCCNPAHLRLLTNIENARDNGNARKTHCPQGHPYNDENTWRTPRGHRQCRQCHRDRRAA